MLAFQQCVVDEKAELDKKIAALGEFIGGKIFTWLPLADQWLLTTQMHFMCSYSAILSQRITRFVS